MAPPDKATEKDQKFTASAGTSIAMTAAEKTAMIFRGILIELICSMSDETYAIFPIMASAFALVNRQWAGSYGHALPDFAGPATPIFHNG